MAQFLKTSKLLPDVEPDKPIELRELSALRKQADFPPREQDGWALELEENGLKVHRLAEVADDVTGKTEERLRCEFEVDCGPVSALMFMKDPERRGMWDDFLGPGMKLINSRERMGRSELAGKDTLTHEFANFRYEGLLGLASKSFLTWSRVQGYDRNGNEREGGPSATTWVMIWRPADIDWPDLPKVDQEYEKGAAWGVVAERIGSAEKTRLKVYVRFKYVSTILTRNVIPRLISYYSSDYCSRFQTMAASKTWLDTEREVMGPYAQKVSTEKLSELRKDRVDLLPPSQAPGVENVIHGAGASGVTMQGKGWSPEKGIPRPANKPPLEDVNVTKTEDGRDVVQHDDDNVPKYQLEYERARRRDPPPLEPLEFRIKGVLSNWRENIANEMSQRQLPTIQRASMTGLKGITSEAARAEAPGFRGSDAWLDSIMGSMSDVRIVIPPWIKQPEREVDTAVPPVGGDVWERLDRAGLGGRPLTEGRRQVSEDGESDHDADEAAAGEDAGWGLWGALGLQEAPAEAPAAAKKKAGTRKMKKHGRAGARSIHVPAEDGD